MNKAPIFMPRILSDEDAAAYTGFHVVMPFLQWAKEKGIRAVPGLGGWDRHVIDLYMPQDSGQDRVIAFYEQTPGFIYVIGNGKHLKIGWTRNWKKRLNHLQTANSETLDLRCLFVGTRAEETNLHARFKSHCVRGEWYTINQDILGWIDGVYDEGKDVSGVRATP